MFSFKGTRVFTRSGQFATTKILRLNQGEDAWVSSAIEGKRPPWRSYRTRSTAAVHLDGPYTGPRMRTTVPGPKAKEMLQNMHDIMESRVAVGCINFEKSQGNYVVDADDNIMLDLFGQISTLPLGYNHPAVVKAATKQENLLYLINRPATPFQPPVNFAEMIRASLLQCAPPGMHQVTTMGCGTCANENAIKCAFISYQDRKRGLQFPEEDSEEFKTALWNKPPGSPDLSVLSFIGGLHGRTIGVLSTTHSASIHKLDIPAFDWPIAPFPQLIYPLEDHVTENKAEEQRCLQRVEELIEEFNSRGKYVAAMIVEPIQAAGGDNHASPYFFRRLKQICKENDMQMIIDEVHTGMGPTGTMWAHEKWGLDEPPDYVTFGKKMQLGGYFHLEGRRPRHENRINNTWMGDPVRMLMLQAIVEEILSNHWIDNVRKTGDVILAGLKQLQELYPQQIHNARGVGTFCAIDGHTVEIRDKLLVELKNNGVMIGGCGKQTIHLRPSLIFQPHHAEIFLNIFEYVLKVYK
ncbi:4-aminobutyrate aminotransferase, mitochondrial-like [Dysidea avara]|uniref:4-aminobutyrate aminotransferase, mitochondrial-like n=1 Tax=Dysidea avara TaxID=196820 RepID=UPI0033181A94